jgi:hypothetical protein
MIIKIRIRIRKRGGGGKVECRSAVGKEMPAVVVMMVMAKVAGRWWSSS